MAEHRNKEVLIRGRLYDVTNFRKVHPGGSIFNLFVPNPGKQFLDASQVFGEFHHNSKRAEKMLKTLRSRPYQPEAPSDAETALLHDFAKLKAELVRDGFFEPNLWHVAWRIAEAVAWLALGVWLVLRGWTWTGLVTLGLAQGRCGWVMHEGGHTSLTGSFLVDRLIMQVFCNVGMGSSAAYYRYTHNRHHAKNMHVGHDSDLQSLPLVAFDRYFLQFAPKSKPARRWLQWQAFLFPTVICLLIGLASKFYIYPRYIVRIRHYGELSLLALRWVLIVYLFRDFSALHIVGGYLAATWVGATYLYTSFAISHLHTGVIEEDEHTNWVENAALHTTNCTPSPLCNWYMGFLNFQIEHHLFPAAPQYRHPQIAPRVKALLAKHDIKYDCKPFFTALGNALRNLHHVGSAAIHDM